MISIGTFASQHHIPVMCKPKVISPDHAAPADALTIGVNTATLLMGPRKVSVVHEVIAKNGQTAHIHCQNASV